MFHCKELVKGLRYYLSELLRVLDFKQYIRVQLICTMQLVSCGIQQAVPRQLKSDSVDFT